MSVVFADSFDFIALSNPSEGTTRPPSGPLNPSHHDY